MNKNILVIIAVVLFSTAILYLPFLLKLDNVFGIKVGDKGMYTVYRNYDGPLYIIPAKYWYDPKQIEPPGKGSIMETGIPARYFAAHLPLYPFFIAVFAPVLGFLKSMLFVNILFTVFLALTFYYMLVRFKLTKYPLLLTVVMLFLPRFLVVRTVGAPESMFMFFVVGSLLFFEKKQYFIAGLLGGLATMTKSPGILLFGAYGLVFLEHIIRKREFDWRWFGILLIPAGLLAVFSLYAVRYGDFWAYFNSGDNIHLVAPYSVFNFQQTWVGTAWLEEIIFYYGMYILTVITFKDSVHRSFFYFGLVFLTATLFVQHRDIARYSLPLWPLACIAFQQFLTSRKFMWMFLILLPGIFMYAWNFIIFNMLPVSNWAPFI